MNGLFGDEVLWFAKNVNKPSVQFEANAGPQAGAFVMGAGQAGQKLGYINPGALQAFSPISITFIDPNGTEEGNNRVVDRLMQYLETNAKTNDYYGLANASNNFGTLEISQLAHKRVSDLTRGLDASTVASAAAATAAAGAATSAVAAGASAAIAGATRRDSNLEVVERWTLHQAHLLSVDFGNLDYSADGFVEIQATVGYTGFEVELGTSGKKNTYAFGNKPK
jgi:hypothetical protein